MPPALLSSAHGRVLLKLQRCAQSPCKAGSCTCPHLVWASARPVSPYDAADSHCSTVNISCDFPHVPLKHHVTLAMHCNVRQEKAWSASPYGTANKGLYVFGRTHLWQSKAFRVNLDHGPRFLAIWRLAGPPLIARPVPHLLSFCAYASEGSSPLTGILYDIIVTFSEK